MRQALLSVLAQSQPAEEIIVVDNGSQPLSIKDLPDGPIRIQRCEPYMGGSRARNHGAKLASQPYLAFLDDDDLWHPDYLRQMATRIDQSSGCFVGRLYRLGAEGPEPFKSARARLDVPTWLKVNAGVTGSNIVTSRECFEQIGGFDPQLVACHDKALVIDLLLGGFPITYVEAIAIFRPHCSHQRLSAPAAQAKGQLRFIQKYRHLMSPSIKLWNYTRLWGWKRQLVTRPWRYVYTLLFRLARAWFRRYPLPGLLPHEHY